MEMLETVQSFVAMNDIIIHGSDSTIQAAISWLTSPPVEHKDEILNPKVVDVTAERAIVTYDSMYVGAYMQKLEQDCFVLVDLIGVSELSDTIITYKHGKTCQTALGEYLDNLSQAGDPLGLCRLYADLNEE